MSSRACSLGRAATATCTTTTRAGGSNVPPRPSGTRSTASRRDFTASGTQRADIERREEVVMANTARGTFEVTGWDEKPFAQIGEGGKLTKASVKGKLDGDITGEA